MNTEKLLVIFREVEELKDRLHEAISAAGELRDMNSDSENVKTLIKQFSNLDALTKKKIDDINKASSLFVGQTYIAIGLAFLSCMVLGIVFGYLGTQKVFSTYIQESVLKDRTTALVNEELRVEQEKQKLALCYKAKEKGVEFYESAIELPISPKKIQESSNGKAAYFY